MEIFNGFKYLLLVLFIDMQLDKINGLPLGRLQNQVETVKNKTDLPPLLFPDDSEAFNIMPSCNETALKILQHEAALRQKLLASKSTSTPNSSSSTSEISTELLHKSMEDLDNSSAANSNENPKSEVEDLQPIDKTKPKIEIEEQFKNRNTLPSADYIDNTVVDQPTLHHGHILAIIAGVMALLCICAYASLVLWRNILERKYGMRERLVTDDTYCSTTEHRFSNVDMI